MMTKLQVIELKVRLHCKSCEATVRKALCNIKGVRCVEINVASNEIRVMGNVDWKVLVKTVRKTGRRVELISRQMSSCRPVEDFRRQPPRRKVFKHAFLCIIPKCISTAT